MEPGRISGSSATHQQCLRRSYERLVSKLTVRRNIIWTVALQARPCSEDRTQSPAGVSQNWEYFGMWPETFGNFARPVAKSGSWRPFAELEKPAVGGHFSD